MPDTSHPQSFQGGSTVISSLRYRDAHAAIDFLERAFGFTRHVVYPGENGTVGHAELRHGTGMVMLGSATNPSLSPLFNATPEEVGGRVTSSLYIVVPDCKPIWDSARAASAEVVMDLRTMDYGGQAFTVRDPEGYLWGFGEYDPWTAREPATDAQSASNGA